MTDKLDDPSTNAPAPGEGSQRGFRPDGVPSPTDEERDQQLEEDLKDEMTKDGAGGD